MSTFDADTIRHVTSGRWLCRPERSAPIEGVTIDSRAAVEGRAFVAIRGERFDGHDFVEDAVDAGASMVIVERDIPLDGVAQRVPVLKVDATRRALLRLAAAHRQRLAGTRVIAVTGSSGKTTTRRLIHAVLSTRWRGSESPKSFNNDLGVPLTVLAASPADKYLLVEIGMNAPGEIADLAAAVQPDIGVVTSAGLAHLGGLGSAEAIAHEKASLLRHLRPGGLSIANADNPLLREHLRGLDPLITFGRSPDADLRLTARRVIGPGGAQEIEVNERGHFVLPLAGCHNAINALAAIAVGRRMGLDDEAIAEGLAAAPRAVMRGAEEIITVDGGDVRLTNDAYNANPDSMAAGFETFLETTDRHPGRRVVILGDMLELGPDAPELHARVGERVAMAGDRIALALFVGELMGHAAATAAQRLDAERVIHFDTVDEVTVRRVTELLQPGDAVLLKASRGMALERIAEALRQAAADRATPCGGGPRA